MDNPEIVIVEDDQLVGTLSSEILTENGYSVKMINESREALATIRECMPKLVITDIMMPGITGMDICKAIKINPDLKHIKVMIMSAKSFETERRRAAMMGANHFLIKPFTQEGLLAAVSGLIGEPGSNVDGPA